MKVIICDDEPLARDRLKRMLNKIETVEQVDEAANGVELLEKVQQVQPDLVLTDIRMPAMDGLEAAEHIAQMPEPPALVFCTAYDEYAIKAFQVQAIGYLLKPVRQEQLEAVLRQAAKVNKAQLASVREQIEQHESMPQTKQRAYISAKSHRGIELIPVDDVRYFMADQKYVTVRYKNGETLVDETLKGLEAEFGERFVRVHRNALVSIAHVDGIEHVDGQYRVRFVDIEDRVAISRRQASSIKKLLKELY